MKAHCERHLVFYEAATGCEDCHAMAKPEPPRCEAKAAPSYEVTTPWMPLRDLSGGVVARRGNEWLDRGPERLAAKALAMLIASRPGERVGWLAGHDRFVALSSLHAVAAHKGVSLRSGGFGRLTADGCGELLVASEEHRLRGYRFVDGINLPPWCMVDFGRREPATATITAVDRDAGTITYSYGTGESGSVYGGGGPFRLGDEIAVSANDGWSAYKSELRAADEAMRKLNEAFKADLERSMAKLWREMERQSFVNPPRDEGLRAWLPRSDPAALFFDAGSARADAAGRVTEWPSHDGAARLVPGGTFFGVDRSLMRMPIIGDPDCPRDSAYLVSGKLFTPPSMEGVFVRAAERAKAEPCFIDHREYELPPPSAWGWAGAAHDGLHYAPPSDHVDALRYAVEAALPPSPTAATPPAASAEDRNERAYAKALDSGLDPPWARLPGEPVLAWARRAGVDLGVYGGDAWPYGGGA